MQQRRPSDRPPRLSKAELEVLKVLWENGPATVRDIVEVLDARGAGRAYTTVLTFLHRLQAKGCVQSERAGTAHRFRPSVTRSELLRGRLGELADELAGGQVTPLVHALVEGDRFSAREIEQFRELLDGLENRSETKKRRQKRRRRGAP